MLFLHHPLSDAGHLLDLFPPFRSSNPTVRVSFEGVDGTRLGTHTFGSLKAPALPGQPWPLAVQADGRQAMFTFIAAAYVCFHLSFFPAYGTASVMTLLKFLFRIYELIGLLLHMALMIW